MYETLTVYHDEYDLAEAERERQVRDWYARDREDVDLDYFCEQLEAEDDYVWREATDRVLDCWYDLRPGRDLPEDALEDVAEELVAAARIEADWDREGNPRPYVDFPDALDMLKWKRPRLVGDALRHRRPRSRIVPARVCPPTPRPRTSRRRRTARTAGARGDPSEPDLEPPKPRRAPA